MDEKYDASAQSLHNPSAQMTTVHENLGLKLLKCNEEKDILILI